MKSHYDQNADDDAYYNGERQRHSPGITFSTRSASIWASIWAAVAKYLFSTCPPHTPTPSTHPKQIVFHLHNIYICNPPFGRASGAILTGRRAWGERNLHKIIGASVFATSTRRSFSAGIGQTFCRRQIDQPFLSSTR